MKIETLKKDNKKKIAIGVIAVISIISTIVLASSMAKYKLTESIPLANGEINYTVPDLNVLAMYQENETGEYEKTDIIPESGYTFSSESYCAALKNEKFTKDDSITINYDMNTKTINIVPLTKKTRCYLYFDKKSNASDTILGEITPNPGSDSFTGIETTDKGIFTGTDNDGTTYYWRGAVTNNYLKFANKWWRIIRINGDGTIRIIYDGTAYHANGSSTTDSRIGTSAFNSSYNDNAYVGFMYGATGQSTYAATHTNTNKSTIMTTLETWYANNLAAYESKIDRNAGFCGDRSINTGSEVWWISDTNKGYGTNTTAYGPFSRILTSGGGYNSTQTPTFNCPNNNDLYTVKGASKGNKAMDKPIGLITADEVIYAGGFGGANNTSYYLRNGSVNYWTMSPFNFNSSGIGSYAFVLHVNSSGRLGYLYTNNASFAYDVRTVINLRADVPITGSGTGSDPFVVN